MRMMSIVVVTAVLGLAVDAVRGQQARLEFEVASVRPNEPGAPVEESRVR